MGDDYLNRWVLVTDKHMDIDEGSSYYARAMARTKFIEGIRFQESAALVHVFNGGGPHPRVLQVAAVTLPMSNNQPVVQAAKRARKAEERTERAAKRPAHRRGRGRGRGCGRGQLPVDSSDEDEEVGAARTPPPRAPALPCSGTSGSVEDSDEDSDEEDDESDSGSSPSLDD